MIREQTTSPSLLRDGLARARRLGRSVLLSLTEPTQAVDPLGFFAAGRHLGDRTYWERPDARRAMIGLGAAATFEPTGPARFAELARTWRELRATAVVDLPADAPPGAGPVLIGGLAFDPSDAPRDLPEPSPWRDLPRARVVLPRFVLSRMDDRAWLTTNLLVGPDDDPSASWPTPPRPTDVEEPDNATLDRRDVLPADEWMRIVADAGAAIRHGAFEKVVLAREVVVRADAPFSPVAALARLRVAYPSCCVFALAQESFAFLGATPERLARVTGGRLDVSCLAGTARRGATLDEDEQIGRDLMSSPKNRIEHAIVARMLRDRLAPLADRLEMPDQPALMRVRNVQHLYTPITGALRPGADLLDLVAGLHPTPAVGGFPDEPALRFIRRRERLDRGWYAGPFGWVDGRGDGEFAVALRSALLRQPRGDGFAEAHLYAGCGIVGDSDPASELDESCLKLRPMLTALGG